MKRIISLLFAIFLTVTPLSGCRFGFAGGSGGKAEKYTLMIYMVGSDLESKSMKASEDITEMLDCGLDTSNVNLLVYTGGTSMWYYDIPSDVNTTYLLTKDEDGEAALEELTHTDKLLSMGEPETLSSFLSYAHENYPADRYGLICWDHGSGPLLGFGKDIRFDNDRLDAEELRTALESSPFNGDKKLDFIGFDACLMSGLEIADIVKNHAQYMIASQEEEPGDGWDYSFLSVMNECFDTPGIAKRILDSYMEHYEKLRSATFNPDLTLACMDLSKTDAVNEAMDALFGRMTASLDSNGYYERSIERSRLKSFGDASYDNRGLSMDLVDVGNLALECQSDFIAESDALQKALDDFVILNRTNLSNATGVSLYYPYYGTEMYEQEGSKQYESLTGSENYRSYLKSYIEEWTQAREKNDTGAKAVPKADISGDSLTYKLTKEQKKTFSRAYLNIYAKPKDASGYKLLLLGSRLYPDGNGVLKFSADQRVPAINGKTLIALAQRSQAEGVTYYETLGATVLYEQGDVMSGEHVTVKCSVEDNSDEIVVNSIEYNDTKNGEDDISRAASGKNTVNADRWDSLAFPGLSGIPTKAKNGEMLPFSQWDDDGSYLWNDVPLSEVVGFSMQSINNIPDYTADEFYYQVVIEDNSGTQHWGEMVQFKKSFEATEITQKSPHGAYTYALYPDHAKLIKYEGTDKELIIPDSVEKLPVTEISHSPFASTGFQKSGSRETIASLTIENPDITLRHVDFSGIRKIYLPKGMTAIPNYAFNHADRVEEVIIPDTVTTIGYHAFSGMNALKKLELPAGVEHIGYGAFFNSRISEGVSFKGDNQNYVVKDDLLLSKDGKLLHTVFLSKNTALTIPEGVEEILPYAHMGGEYTIPGDKEDSILRDYSLTAISFPESLKRIRYHAFANDSFNELILPDGLEEIGNYAFASCGVSKNRDLKVIETLSLGSRLKRLGYRILGGSRFGTIAVSEKNRYFAVKDNILTNKHKDAELSEVALSGSDNLTLNKMEYEAYELITNGLDMSLYKKSALPSDNKTYDGHDYSLYLELNDQNRFTYQHPGTEITLCGVDMTLPASYDKLKQTGLSADEKSAAKKTIQYSEFINFKNDQGDQVTASLYDNSGDEVPIEKSKLKKLEFTNWGFSAEETRLRLDFNYHGITSESSLQDVIKALGAPSEMEINVNEVEIADSSIVMINLTYNNYISTGNLISTNFHTHEETHHISNGGCSIALSYYPKTKTSAITSFTLEASE